SRTTPKSLRSSDSVNLLTSRRRFPMILASLQGKEDLNPPISNSYSCARVQEQVNTWNRTAPTGIVGLDWIFGYRSIYDHYEWYQNGSLISTKSVFTTAYTLRSCNANGTYEESKTNVAYQRTFWTMRDSD
ncbi:MAG: hypothetical protein AAF901_10345, partial [Bacteroidota bacterium]